jgi:hypothetical protein
MLEYCSLTLSSGLLLRNKRHLRSIPDRVPTVGKARIEKRIGKVAHFRARTLVLARRFRGEPDCEKVTKSAETCLRRRTERHCGRIL